MPYIFVSKDRGGNYRPEEIIEDLDSHLGGLEYGDVKAGEFQIWEYPSGIIYAVEADREVAPENYYATPYSTKGVIWEPRLRESGVDLPKVTEAYNRIRH